MMYPKILTAISLLSVSGVAAFTPSIHQTVRPSLTTSTNEKSTMTLNVNIPRVELPSAVADKLSDFDLSNPNTMTDAEYRSYSGAAIAGTLLFFLIPGAVISGLYDNLGNVISVSLADFAFSALIGGGLAIYLSLRSDSIGETAREYGYKVLSAAKDTIGIPTLRYDLPSAVTDVMTTDPLNLINPNTMDEKEYDGYSGAAVAGTLAFFVLPGAIIAGVTNVLGEFLGTAVFDFAVSALIGGGLAIYLSLRSDSIGESVNSLGSKFLDKVDDIIGGDDTTTTTTTSTSDEAKSVPEDSVTDETS